MRRRQFIYGAATALLAVCGPGNQAPQTTAAPRLLGSVTTTAAVLTQDALDEILLKSIDMKGWSQLLPYQPGDAHTQHLDNIRMLGNIGAKLAAFVANPWLFIDTPFDVEDFFSTVARVCADIHAALPDVIVGGACYETTAPAVNRIPVPDWVFQEFSLPVQARNFDWQKMSYPDLRVADGNPNSRAIDITQVESRMWYFYMCKRLIDAGYEDIHLGELFTITQHDIPSYANFSDVLLRIRRYAAKAGRRGFVLLQAQTFPANDAGQWDDANGKHGPVDGTGNLLLDYCYAPTRAKENPDFPYEASLAVYHDVIFGRSRGGMHPLGWRCDRGPYIVQLDNGASPDPRRPIGWPYVWGWSEPDWFINQTPAYRRDWLRYALTWIRRVDPVGHFRPTGHNSGGGLPGIDDYHANIPWYGTPDDPNVPDSLKEPRDEWFKGFNDEPEIAALWSANGQARVVNGEFARPQLSTARPYALAPAIPSWDFVGECGITLSAGIYGSANAVAGKQYGFVAGSAKVSQTILFNAPAKCVFMLSIAQRKTAAAADNQTVELTLDGTVVGRITPGAAFSRAIVSCGTVNAGVHTLSVNGKTASDCALFTDVQLLTAASYTNVVQQLYLAYYGRPADPAGLDYWSDVFLGMGAAIDAQALTESYGSAGPRFLVDSFGTSQESLDLYGSGNFGTFISAVYQNVLGRAPDAAGAAYWVDALQRNLMTQAQAAVTILGSTTVQDPSSTDFQVVAKRTKAAAYFTDRIRAKNLAKAYSGSAANASARALLATVHADTGDDAIFTIVDNYVGGLPRT
jgi:hypothetical protein